MRTFWIALAVAFRLAVPAAAAAQDAGDDGWDDDTALPVEIHGFVEGVSTARVVRDATTPDDFVASEARFRLDLAHYADRAEAYFKGDFTWDGVTEETDVDVRQAAILLRAGRLDVRAGRQVLTWGTGDLLFLNDLFPKDFVSFFIGRDDEYLKAPSDAIRVTVYSHLANLDVVWTPVFEPDRFIDGTRLSFFDPGRGRLRSAGRGGAPLAVRAPDRALENGELAARLYRTLGGYEAALYGYVGFAKEPQAFDPASGLPAFGELAAYGASVRGPLLGGIANVEGAYYDAYEDRAGDDPTLPNAQARGLAGYEHELRPNVTLGLQYYVEWTADYAALIAHSPAPRYRRGYRPRETYCSR